MAASASSPKPEVSGDARCAEVVAGSSGAPSGGSAWLPLLGSGKRISRAAPKITTITAMRTRLASETMKIDQCRYRPGPFRLMTANSEARPTGPLLSSWLPPEEHLSSGSSPGSGATTSRPRLSASHPLSITVQLAAVLSKRPLLTAGACLRRPRLASGQREVLVIG
jgi:hypothetical protein